MNNDYNNVVSVVSAVQEVKMMKNNKAISM